MQRLIQLLGLSIFVLALSAFSLAIDVQAAALTDGVPDLPARVTAQQVYRGASLSRQAMSTYRIVTLMNPDTLLEEVEKVWSQHPSGRVWRDAHGGWLTLSRVVRPPVAEVIQARTNRSGGTEAWLTIGHESGSGAHVAIEHLQPLLPEGSTLIQQFSSRDEGRVSSMLIAKASGAVQTLAAQLESRSRQAHFTREPRFHFAGNKSQSFVAFFNRGKEELIVTLDREGPAVAVVLQYTAPAGSLTGNAGQAN